MSINQGSLVTRFLIQTFGGLYNDLIGRRSHLGVAGVIFDDQGRVLLVHQSYGRRGWDVPGGGRERRESIDTALHRELREELSVELSAADLRAVHYEPAVDQHHFTFRCELSRGSTPRANPPEILELGYFSLDALPRPINDFTIERINAARSSSPVGIIVLGPRRWLE